jgi:TatD DNase family protein
MAASRLAGRERAGVMHSFSAESHIAQRALDLGFYLGFTGPLTYKKADDLREIAKTVPLDRILIETDAPFLAPHPYRGKRNEPLYVVEVAKRLAELHSLSLERIAEITTANAERLFGLSEPQRSQRM